MTESLEIRQARCRHAALAALEAERARARPFTAKWFALVERFDFVASALALGGLAALSGVGTLTIVGAQSLGPAGWTLGALCLLVVAATAAYIYGDVMANTAKLAHYEHVVGRLAEAEVTLEALEEELALERGADG